MSDTDLALLCFIVEAPQLKKVSTEPQSQASAINRNGEPKLRSAHNRCCGTKLSRSSVKAGTEGGGLWAAVLRHHPVNCFGETFRS
jgi:hypothetical protein